MNYYKNKTSQIFLSIFISFFSLSFSQTPKSSGEHSRTIDSLTSRLQQNLHDTDRGNTLLTLAGIYSYQNPDSAILLATEAKKIAKAIKDAKRFAKALNELGRNHYVNGDYPKALRHYFAALKIFEKLSPPSGGQGGASTLGNIGIVYYFQADYPKVLDYYFKALKIKDELGDKNGIAIWLGNIGSVYKDQADYPKALDYYSKVLKIAEELGDKRTMAATLGNIGVVYKEQSDYPKVHPVERDSLLNRAFDYYFLALKAFEELGDKKGIEINLGNIGMIYFMQKKYSLAIENAGKAQQLANKIGAINDEKDDHHTLYETYKAMGNSTKALEHYEKFILLRDSIFKIENQKEILRKQMKFDYEKKAAADSVKNAEAQKVKEAQIQTQQAQIKQERTQRYALYGGLTLVLLFAGFIFNRFRVTRKQKKIIEEQKKLVEIKNEEILDSIQYAMRIQQALLPTESYLKKYLPEHFIFYRPKDVVSGDFYYLTPLPPSPEREGGVLLCVADCTGHGVPGAFMSLLGMSFLNEIITERNIASPGRALDMLREEIIRTLNPEGKDDIKDGMEIALCRYNFGERPTPACPAGRPDPSQREGNAILSPPLEGAGGGLLEYASANIKLLLVRNGNLQELETDTMPVGVGFGITGSFHEHRITLEKGDMIYAFSDGFGDQFGGHKGKRFKRGKLNELLLSISNKPVEEQKTIIENTFNEWRGNLEQTDDVCVIGIRI
ncbi:MAG: tetratricopeptide repeat protein [Bacteroidetes bacterium]|nr:tetratricopeptide repeat protein [Bacteroidota bacterium]